MQIKFTKAHGAKNDFLFTWAADLPANTDLPRLAMAICDRHTGVGADGWMLITPGGTVGVDGAIRLFNPDGSEPEMSGNGTRCAAALLLERGYAHGTVRVLTGAGPKSMDLQKRQDHYFLFEMNMGKPAYREEELRYPLELADGVTCDATILNVGNPQCAVFVDEIPADWVSIGTQIERHPMFPNRTNVSFIRVVNPHIIEVRFFERGVGETMSSGTGSTGAMAAAYLRGLIQNPVTVQTPAGDLSLRWDDDIFLTGPAEITTEGVFFFQ